MRICCQFQVIFSPSWSIFLVRKLDEFGIQTSQIIQNGVVAHIPNHEPHIWPRSQMIQTMAYSHITILVISQFHITILVISQFHITILVICQFHITILVISHFYIMILVISQFHITILS